MIKFSFAEVFGKVACSGEDGPGDHRQHEGRGRGLPERGHRQVSGVNVGIPAGSL